MNIERQISIIDNQYKYVETFDTNLSTAYENSTWSEWHVVREFISNALDAVNQDTDLLELKITDGFYSIHDYGSGFPIVYAKRIGCSSKKDDSKSIGMFGEGAKLSLLTCVRHNIRVLLASQDWLIEPKAEIFDEQQILMFDIYKSNQSIDGCIVMLEATNPIRSIMDNLPQYFLHYGTDDILYGNVDGGILRASNGTTKLFNKGVYVKDIKSLFSYSLSMEGINRDRDLISHYDLSSEIRYVWQQVDDPSLIKHLLLSDQENSGSNNENIEFYYTIYTNHPDAWAKAFWGLFGEDACICTNDIASREAEILGMRPIKGINSGFSRILIAGGVKEDFNCLNPGYEFIWHSNLTASEQELIDLLPLYARMAGFQNPPSTIRIFEEYRNHAGIFGCYSRDTQEVFLKHELMQQGIEKTLQTYLHEATHHESGCDDLDRNFADHMCTILAKLLVKHINETGLEDTLIIQGNTLALPDTLKLSAMELSADITALGSLATISLGYKSITFHLSTRADKPISFHNRKVSVKNGKFVMSLPDSLVLLINQTAIPCKVIQ